MKKTMLLVFVIASAGGVFAQNMISAEASLLGGGARYERVLNPTWSLGVNAYYSSMAFFFDELGLDLCARFYPFGGGASYAKGLFFGLGLGYHWRSGAEEVLYTNNWGGINRHNKWVTSSGIGITPEIGWKLDIGAAGGFFVSPGLKIPVTIGWKNILLPDGGNLFGVSVGFVPYVGLGYAFQRKKHEGR